MTWLVTGGSGFLGRHVLNALSERPDRVVSLGRRLPAGWPVRDFARADLDNPASLARAIVEVSPDVVIHAAGKTPPAPSALLYRANTRATAFLLDALRSAGRPVRVILTGSAAELGPVPVEKLPVGEDFPCRPADAYGLSKWAATRLGLAESSLDVVVARIFNPIGPGLPTTQAFGRFASLLAGAGPAPYLLPVGDLDARRDFIDIRDVAESLLALAERGRAGTLYHVGTGVSRSVAEGLQELIRLSGREVRLDTATGLASRRGPSDSRADIRRIVAHTGWAPRIDWKRSLADLWDAASRPGGGRRVA